jgi:hypothetical protein
MPFLPGSILWSPGGVEPMLRDIILWFEASCVMLTAARPLVHGLQASKCPAWCCTFVA